ncbi:MAG: HWE histidine kinase domain-containing protein [Pseudomonadota bacterium]|nr:HWE histidine kinase domain-containing protein [Pseudomonadota bacterium]
MSTSIITTIFDQMPNPAMVLNAKLIFADANQAYCQAVGKTRDELIGRHLLDVFPTNPDQSEFVIESFRRALTDGPVRLENKPYNFPEPHDPADERVWQVSQFAVHCDEGGADYLVQRCEDITEREELRRQRDLVTAELNHRVRNTLAVVQSMAEQTGQTSDDVDAFLRSFSGRLAAMSRNFAALTDSHWSGLPFEKILRTELEPYVGPDLHRVTLNGPPVVLSVRASKNSSMLVHEMVTNAAKHGFLAHPSGRLHVRWWIDDDMFHVDWKESGLDGIRAPDVFGFGFQLFEMMPNIVTDPAFEPDGLRLKFSVPISVSVASGEVSFPEE